MAYFSTIEETCLLGGPFFRTCLLCYENARGACSPMQRAVRTVCCRVDICITYVQICGQLCMSPFFYPVSRKNILSLSSAHMVSTLCFCWMVAETLSSIVCLSTTDHKSIKKRNGGMERLLSP